MSSTLMVVEVPTVPDVDARVKQWKGLRLSKPERELLAEFRMHRWRGATVYALVPRNAQSVTLGMIAVAYAKRPRDPYVNVYTLFTDPQHRREGVMHVLLDHVEHVALQLRKYRLKSKASSLGALALYHKRRYTLVGWSPKGYEVLVDTLIPPGRGPSEDVALDAGRGWTGAQVRAVEACPTCGALWDPRQQCGKCGHVVDGQLTFDLRA